MDIRIIKDSEVTIHDQLAEEITFSIATGNLKPGQALPSVRALARRLKIHHNTVSQVYQDLVGRNLLIRRRGSRMVVRSPGDLEYPPRVEDLDDLINATIQAAQEKGYTLQQLRQRVQERLMALPPDHLLAVSSDPGIRHLLREELKEKLPFPVEACSPDDLSQNPELTVGALVVGAPGAIPKIVSLVPKDRPAISITFSALDEHVKMIRQLRKPSTIAVVSISELVLQTARGVLAPVIGQRHTIREYLLTAQSPSGLGATDLVLCDLIAYRRVRARKLVEYRLVSPACLEQLSSAMKA
ncbi:GntR family transcriptional regulator [Acidobacteria bacterium AH-259-L09]|nr:GntR family transcriptional regulator [Acidobacteria bacterium AH-259-L09]